MTRWTPRFQRTLATTLFLAFWCTSQLPAATQSARQVSLELVLMIDVSASVNDEEFALQREGLAYAFRHEVVQHAIDRSRGGIAIAVIQWANHDNQKIAVDWTQLATRADAETVAAQLATMPRLIDGGHTAIGTALQFGLRALQTNGFIGRRRVIDLSGDGRTNAGVPLRPTRADVLSHGVTINGLAIINELPLLAEYFRDYLIGGDDAFVLVARDYHDFARAMAEKLEREIRSAPLSQIPSAYGTRHAANSLKHSRNPGF